MEFGLARRGGARPAAPSIKGRQWPQQAPLQAGPAQAEGGLLLPGQGGGNHGMGPLDVGPDLGRGQDPGVVERYPLGARQIGRGAEARRMRQRLIVLRRTLEADAANRMIGRRNQAEHLAADLEDDHALPLHGPRRGRQRAAERIDLLRRHGATLHGGRMACDGQA